MSGSFKQREREPRGIYKEETEKQTIWINNVESRLIRAAHAVYISFILDTLLPFYLIECCISDYLVFFS